MSNSNGLPAIEAQGLCKTYSKGLFNKQSFEALRNVSFQVNRGEIFGLLGPNGAGKTTFIKVLLGIIRSTGGRAQMLGLDVGTLASRRRVGYLPEHLRIRRHHTGLTALEYYGQLSGLPMSEIRPRREELLELVGLSERKKDYIKEYSKGMLQRLGLAQSLLHDPELIILDEPTDGLDPAARADVRATLARLRDQGKTIFLNSHILQEVELICDRVAILNRGDLRYCGPVKDIGQRLAAGEQSHMQVRLQLQGNLETIQTLINDFDGINKTFRRLEDLVANVNIELADQALLDQLIDQLRAGEISILALSRDQVTLEDAFLRLVSETTIPAETHAASTKVKPLLP